ncbi:hypothetical protein ACUY2Q_09275 [Corynebacterium bovis]
MKKLRKPPYIDPPKNRFTTRRRAGSNPAASRPSATARIWSV